jgi:hypothetical protein
MERREILKGALKCLQVVNEPKIKPFIERFIVLLCQEFKGISESLENYKTDVETIGKRFEHIKRNLASYDHRYHMVLFSPYH